MQYARDQTVHTYTRDFVATRTREFCVAVWMTEDYWEVCVWDLGPPETEYEKVLGMPKRRVGPLGKEEAMDLMAETLARLFMGADPYEVVQEAADGLDLFELNEPDVAATT